METAFMQDETMFDAETGELYNLQAVQLPPQVTTFGSRLTAAKVALMSEVKRMEKQHVNQHGGYKFTSVDDFKDVIRPLMAKHGLSLHISEEGFDLATVKNAKDKESTVAKIRFRFVLTHTSGERSEPSHMTVCLPYTGAQTSGAAQSYAIKEGVYKGLFQASSGDVSEEADLHDQGKFMAAERLSKAEAKPLYEALERDVRAYAEETRDAEKFLGWWQNNLDQIRLLPVDWELNLKQTWIAEGKQLRAQEAMDRAALNG
jgi:hypothetical protein